MTILFTHVCRGSGRFEASAKGDRRMHLPRGWQSHDEHDRCSDCGDASEVRGRVLEVAL